MLLGSDYDSQGVRGIGPKSALKFLRSIPEQHDPVEYLRTILLRNNPQNKYERKVLNFFKENQNSIKHFDKIIKEYTSLQLDNVQLIASIASIKWLKPVRVKELQKYMEEKLQWMESLTFSKVMIKICFLQLNLSSLLSFFFKDFTAINSFSNTLSIKYARIGRERCSFSLGFCNFSAGLY